MIHAFKFKDESRNPPQPCQYLSYSDWRGEWERELRLRTMPDISPQTIQPAYETWWVRKTEEA